MTLIIGGDATRQAASTDITRKGLSMHRKLIIATTCLLLVSHPGFAQLDQLRGALGGGAGSSAGAAVGLPSVAQAGPGNLAGILQYCVKNNMLGGGDASSTSSSLLSRVSGQNRDAGYQSGSRGLLDTGNGQNFSLAGGGIKQQISQKVCGLVLQRAKSLL